MSIQKRKERDPSPELWVKFERDALDKLMTHSGDKAPGIRLRIAPWRKNPNGMTLWVELKRKNPEGKWECILTRKIAIHNRGTMNYFPDGGPPQAEQMIIGNPIVKQGPVPR